MCFKKIFRKKSLPKEEIEHLSRLEQVLGYTFWNLERLKRSLTHKSYSNELRLEDLQHNERLEFLGDAVLELVISDLLIKHFPKSREGLMSKIRASLVNEEALAKRARQIELGKYLFLGKGEEQGEGREKNSLLSDAFEALLGAIYLDSNLQITYKIIKRLFLEELLLASTEDISRDFKTKLQEEAQNRFRVAPEYRLIDEIGPDHDKIFEIHLFINERKISEGRGKSKKQAEQKAAEQALEKLTD